MSTNLNLPQLENGATQAYIERYFHDTGVLVEQGQPLVIVVTDRFEWEIPASSTGTITEIVAQPGTTVAIGAPLLQLEPASEVAPQPEQRWIRNELRATPLARRIAAAHGLSLDDVTGSGRGGKITRSDVLGVLHIEPKFATPTGNGQISAANSIVTTIVTPTTKPESEPTPVTTIAPGQVETLAVSTTRPAFQTYRPTAEAIPYALTVVDVDMTAVLQYVVANAVRLAKRGVMLDAHVCVAYATIDALSRHRLLNSAWHDDGIIVWQKINLGWLSPIKEFEVPLVAPNAADLSLQGLARELQERVSVNGTIRPTFTLSAATAAFWSEQQVTASHTAMLHIGATTLRPHVVEEHGVDTIKLRSLNILTLSYDARIVGQHQADAFLIDVKQRLEHFDALC